MTQTFKPNFITRVATSVVMASSVIFNVMPAEATPVRVAQDVWSAYDSDNNEHVITVERQDREGDFLIRVNVPARQVTQSFWIDCRNDLIGEARTDASWEAVDHRKMEGWYSDVACRLN